MIGAGSGRSHQNVPTISRGTVGCEKRFVLSSST